MNSLINEFLSVAFDWPWTICLEIRNGGSIQIHSSFVVGVERILRNEKFNFFLSNRNARKNVFRNEICKNILWKRNIELILLKQNTERHEKNHLSEI